MKATLLALLILGSLTASVKLSSSSTAKPAVVGSLANQNLVPDNKI